MAEKLPFFNWSLSRLLETEKETFNKAKIRILYFLLLFSILKVLITISAASLYDQTFQFWRGIVALVIYLLFLKVLLASKKNVNLLSHLMLISGLIITWSVIFISAQRINIVTMQFIFMVILTSFYLLNRTWGLVYSMLAILPVILFLLLFNDGEIEFLLLPNLLVFPARFLIIVLNFVTFTVVHLLYRDAFQKLIESKQELNVQLEVALKNAENLAQSKSDFLSTMSHELRTPLNMVIGMTELIQGNKHDKEQEENLKMLKFGADNLYALINDILDFNKLESGKLHLEKVQVNLKELMSSITNSMQFQAKEKGLELLLKMDDQLDKLIIITDPLRLSQVIYNLIGNGIKFTPKGSVVLHLEVKELNKDFAKIKFNVNDTGIGISEEQQLRIFEPFTQASSNTTRNYGGTGLGLSIVTQLLELCNSKINLSSKLGEGTNISFELTMPIGLNDVLNENDVVQESKLLEGMRVLIAEDNMLNNFLIKKICAKWNIVPVIVENGFEAIEQIETNIFDVVLMDLHMPEMDGYAATKVIRSLPNGGIDNLRIIAFTASVSYNLEHKIKAAGMNDYLRKPFKSYELYIKLLEIATRKNA